MAETAPRVLVVDDEGFFREAIRDALADASIQCSTAASGEEALALAREPEIGVVVLDVGLPGIGGFEVLRRLGEERPAVRVIIVSADTQQELVLEGLRLGACDYLAKPLHDEELVLAVRRALSSYGIRSSWDSLRARLETLEEELAGLVGTGERSAAELSDRAAAAVATVLGASKTSLMLLAEDGRELRVVAATGRDLDPREMDAVAVGEGVAGVALIGAEPLAVADVEADERFADRGLGDRYQSSSLAIAPVRFGGKPLGVLCATDRRADGHFEHEDLSLLRILALQLGPLLAASLGTGRPTPAHATSGRSVDEAELQRQSDRAGDDDAELARLICDASIAEIEPDRLIAASLRAIAIGVPAAPVSLYLIDPVTGDLVLEGQCERSGPGDRERLPARSGLTGSVAQGGRLIATDAPQRDPRFDPDVDTPEGGEPGALLCVPVRLRKKTLGVLRVFPSDGAPASARTGEVLTAAISAAVRNVLMYRSLLESVDEVAKARRASQESGPVR